MDYATQKQLARGERVVEVLKQPQYTPMVVEKQVVVLYAVTNGYIDEVPVEDVQQWETDYLMFMEAKHQDLLDALRTQKTLDDGRGEAIGKTLEEFNSLR